MGKAGITVAIKGEINDLEAKISQSKEIINDATKQIISENNKLKQSQDAITDAQKTYSNEINKASDQIKRYLQIKSEVGVLTKEEQKSLSAAKAELSLYKTKTKELVDIKKQEQQEIIKTKNAIKELQNLQRASINDARLEIESKKKIIALEKEASSTKDKSAESTSNLANATIRYLRWAGTLAGVIYAGKRAWDMTLGSGIAVNKMIEDNTAGISALLTANTRMTLSNGKVVDSYEKFQLAGTKATEIMDKIRIASTKTYATFPQLTEIYQQAIGQTLSMGTSFGSTVNEISDNTIKLAQRMSNIGGAIGQPMDRIKEEIRSLISGNASTDSIISTMIFGSPSQANEAIKKAKAAGTNGLKDMLESYIGVFDVLEGVKTYTRAELELQDAIQQTQKVIAEPAFNILKDVYVDLANSLRENRELFVEWGKDFIKYAELVIEYADDVLVAFVAWKILPGLLGKINISMNDIKASTSSWGNASLVAAGLGNKLSNSIVAIGSSLKSLVIANGPMLLAIAAYETYNYLVGDAKEKEEALVKARDKTAEQLNKLSTAQLVYNQALLAEQYLVQTKAVQDAKAKVANKGLFGKTEMEQKADQSALAEAQAELEALRKSKNMTEDVLEKRKEIQKFAEQTTKNAEKQAELQLKYATDKEIEEKATKFIEQHEEKIVEYQKDKTKAQDYLVKKEKELAEINAKYSGDTEARKQVEKSISDTKKFLLALDKEIAKESEKNTKSSENKQKAEKKSYLEIITLNEKRAGIEAELAQFRSGEIDEDRLKISLSETKIKRLADEYTYLTQITAEAERKGVIEEHNDKLKEKELEIYKEVYNLNKLTNAELEKQKDFSVVSKFIKPTDMQNLGDIYQQLQVFYQGDEENLAKLESMVERWQDKLDKKPLTVDIKLQGWDEVSNSIAIFGNSFQDINKAQKEYQRENSKVIKDEVKLNQARVDLRDTTLGGITDMTGAIAGFYDEDDDRRKKQLELQKVMYAAKMAMQIADLVQTTAVEGTKQSIYGTTALVNALTAPFPMNIAAYATVAAMLASLGIMIGGKTKTSTSSDYYSSLKANEGKGTVLGDIEAQSQSITKALETLKDFAKPQYQTLQSMNNYLETIANNIGGVTSLLIQQGGFAFGDGYTGFDTGFKNNVSSFGLDKINLFDKLTGTNLMGGIINSVMGGLFGKTSVSQSLTDSGIYFADQYLTNAINELNGAAYQTISTTVSKKSWFGSSSSTSISTYFKALDNETERQFSLVLSNLYNTVIEAGDALDSSAEQTAKSLENFVVSIGKISLKGKTGDQIQETLESIFGSIGDEMASTAFPLLTTFQQVGEGMFDTLVRVATGMEEAEYYIGRLGQAFSDISYTEIINTQGDVGFEALLQSIVKTEEATYGLNNNLVQIIGSLDSTAEELYGTYIALDNLRETFKFLQVDIDAVSFATIRGAGSLDALTTGVSSYIENFLTEQEQLAYSTTILQKEFSKLNIEMPSSKQGFKDLLSSLDTTTESGQELYGRLIILSDSFAEVADKAENLYDDSISRITDVQNAFLDMIDLIDTTINNLLGRQTGANTTEATITTYLQKREQADVLLEKGKTLTDTELSTLNSLVSELASMATTIQSGFEDNTNITENLVTDLALIKSKLNYTNQFVSNDLASAQANIFTTVGFSDGGYTGSGSKYEIKGPVHANEYVINSDELNAIGGAEAVKSMVQREIINKNTVNNNSSITYSNDKSGIIEQLKLGQETLLAGFNAVIAKVQDIVDYNDERRDTKYPVTVTGSVTIQG